MPDSEQKELLPEAPEETPVVETTKATQSQTKASEQTKTISLDEYSRYMRYKKQQEKQAQDTPKSLSVSINQKIASELEQTQSRIKHEKSLLAEANKINEIDNLCKAHLSSHFNKEALINKGYPIAEIMIAQKKELIKKFVPKEQIFAISKSSNIDHISGEILEQLVELAKVNIKKRESNITILKKDNSIQFEEEVSLNNPNFTPRDFSEFHEALANAYRERQVQFYKNRAKKRAIA
ncbi:DUF1357 family protein [Candidatus Borreliella tachyglossi]|nr:DUF1357 family protein [Candidatus Borreliella tachyglossi]